MSSPIECPICMDCIESTTKNCVTTECGHCFHTNCLMKSVAHNGFGCPYCRTKMAEEPEDKDEDGDEEEEIFDDDALRGFRFFWNNINGVEHDEEDNSDEENSEEWEDIDDEEEAPTIPSANFVAEKLRLRNVSYEDLVKILLLRDHDEYQEQEDEEIIERLDGEVFGKMRIIISNYDPQQVVQPVQTVQQVQPERNQNIQTVDLEAQPKTTHIRFTSKLLIDF